MVALGNNADQLPVDDPEAALNQSSEFDTEKLPWAVPAETTGKLHFLWYKDGPPMCQRKQAAAKSFKSTLANGIGLKAALDIKIKFCKSCAAKTRCEVA